MTTTTTTTIGKRRRYPTTDSITESDNDYDELTNSNPPLANKRRESAAADFASHRFIVSERQQLAVLKQLTAGDESNTGSLSSFSLTTQQRSTKIHRRNEHGEIILHTAARKGDLKQLKKALNDGANVNEEDNAGWTPLHEAVTKNQFKAASLLLKSGANSNAPGPDEQTPLIDAVLNNNTKMVGLLLYYSADPSVVDLTRLNETMVKVLKREITTFELSDNENDNDSLSVSSPIASADESEHDEDKIERTPSQSSKIKQKKSFQHFHEHSSDSLSNNKTWTIDNDLTRKNPYDFGSDEDDDVDDMVRNLEQRSISGTSNDSNDIKNQTYLFNEQSLLNDEHIQHLYRVPPLKIILARDFMHKNEDFESNNSSSMDDNSTMETLSLPIIEQNEKFLSTITTSIEFNDKIMNLEKEREKLQENILLSVDKTDSTLLNNTYDQIQPPPEMIISTIINDIIMQIDTNLCFSSFSCEQQESMKKEKQDDLKITTRTLRSHVKEKSNTSKSNQNANGNRRVSNRKRILDKNLLINSNVKFQRKKTLSERSHHTEISNTSDDQTIENIDEKIDRNEDRSLTSDEGNSLIINIKQIHTNPNIDSLPPNKRRLRERNVGLFNSTDASITINSSSIEDNVPIEITTRDLPINGIKRYLEIRQQIDKRHDAMLHDFVLPKVPKDFADTLMAKKNYLIASSFKSFGITTPASLGIKPLYSPSDLDAHLSDIFTRQEDERYRMKLRHHVERDKLILSYEQEILRLYGNATRSSINQSIPLSYCSLLKDNEVYNNPSKQERHSSLINNEYSNTELNKCGKQHRLNEFSFIKCLEDSNLKYKRLSCEINQRQYQEANTLYSMQRMVWLKHIPKDQSSSGGMNSLLSERYLPKVEINTNFWTHWETNSI